MEEDAKLIENTVLSQNEQSPGCKIIDVKITIPELVTPGPHGFFIHIENKVDPNVRAGIHALTALAFKVKINVPYPGKYVDHNVLIEDVVEKEPIFVDVELISRGTENLVNIKGSLTIYDEQNNSVITLDSTNTINSLSPTGSDKLLFDILPKWNISSGMYTLMFNINYDGGNKEFSEQLLIGKKAVLINLQKSNVTINTFLKLQYLVESLWNEEINNVYFEGELYNLSGEIIPNTGFVSSPFTLDSRSSKIIEVYFDANNKVVGDYLLKGQIYLDDVNQNFSLPISIIPEKTIASVKKENSSFSYYVIGILILLILGYVGYRYMKYGRDDYEDEPKQSEKVNEQSYEEDSYYD